MSQNKNKLHLQLGHFICLHPAVNFQKKYILKCFNNFPERFYKAVFIKCIVNELVGRRARKIPVRHLNGISVYTIRIVIESSKL